MDATHFQQAVDMGQRLLASGDMAAAGDELRRAAKTTWLNRRAAIANSGGPSQTPHRMRSSAYPEKRPLQGWWFIMSTGHKHKHPLEEGLEHINPIKGHLLKLFGPADGRGNPLVGTQYDPVVRQKIETERRHERWARQDARHQGQPGARHPHLEGEGAQPEPPEQSTPDRE